MEQPKAAPPPGAAGAGRPERPLGRGIEDVARVFLSQEPEARATTHAGARGEARPLPKEANGQGALLLRPAPATRDQVAAAIREFDSALEDGLRALDAEVPCPPCGEIDLLAVDRANQLTIVDFDTAAGDDLLVRGLGHADWVVANVPNLRRMFRGQAINFSLEPRLLLLAPQFSPLVRRAARQATRLRIDWVRYHFLETPGKPGVFFERLAD
jgi:hypothetical protein